MQTFKTKTFARWARKEGLGDDTLLDAVDKMEKGQLGDSLGGKVYKKRIALPGRGKRGSVRTLIAFKDRERAFFMYGFAKNERSNIDKKELEALKKMSSTLLGQDDSKLNKALKKKELIEVS